MGMVFLAEHPVIGARVALKAIHPQFARSPEVVSRFVNEAKVVNQIRHDHIVDITDFGRTPGGDFYFLMEYLQGETLSESIVRHGAFPVARALNVAAQIADALHASHEHGVIHRDVKPDNVYLVPRGETMDFVKVLDFGLAKLTYEAESPAVRTGAGLIMGSPAYMSPEQCEGRSEIDRRSDIYSLGIILFEMLTGRTPFGGASVRQVLVQHLTARPPAARSLAPDVPPELDAILDRALAKDPAARFQTMAELATALRDLQGLAPKRPSVQVEAIDDDDELRPKRNRGPLLTLVAVAAAAGAFIVQPKLVTRYDLLAGTLAAAARSFAPAPRPAAPPEPALAGGQPALADGDGASAIATELAPDSDPPMSAGRSSARLVFSKHHRHRRPAENDEQGIEDDPDGVLAPSAP